MGTIYLLRDIRFKEQGAPVYKLGKTQYTDGRRFQGYAKGHEIIISIMVDDADKSETELLEVFRAKFKERKDVGSETFEGNRRAMLDEILKHIAADDAPAAPAPAIEAKRDMPHPAVVIYEQIKFEFSNVVSAAGHSPSLYDAYRAMNIVFPHSVFTKETVDISPFAKHAKKQISTKRTVAFMRGDDYVAHVRVLVKLANMNRILSEYAKVADATMVKIKAPLVIAPSQAEFKSQSALTVGFFQQQYPW